jgi:hypothetical protein|tara:strand:+ start:1589 stop:2770 length:1182 start_codon:yes stop_codon:yes gene_type:complete
MRLDNKYVNKTIKEYSQSDAIGFKIDAFKESVNGGSLQDTPAVDAMYQGTSQEYADLTQALKSGKISGDEGQIAQNRLRALDQAPGVTKNFLENLYSVFDGTEEKYYDPNNNYEWALVNKIFKGAPGFGENQGYSIEMKMKEDGSQDLIAYGKPFDGGEFTVNSASLNDMLEAGIEPVSVTPDIPTDMQAIAAGSGVFEDSMIEGDKLKPSALLDIDTYALRGPGGGFEFEEVQINDKQKRKFHKFDKDKILQKVDPFLRAEIAGIMENESSAVAAWNMFIGSKITGEDDAQREIDATAGDNSWSYDLLPLDAKHKRDFYEGYKEYFFDNYLKAFTENIIPEGAEGAIQNIGTQAVKDQPKTTTDQLKDISSQQKQQPQSEAFKRFMQDLNAL